MFDQCGDCTCAASGNPGCFSIGRRIGGFAEYIITSTNTNPVTWFVGRRYRTALYSQNFTQDWADVCNGMALSHSNSWNCVTDYSWTNTSSFSAFTNVPSVSATGDLCTTPATTGLAFRADGYYGWYGNVYNSVASAFGTYGDPVPCDSDPVLQGNYVFYPDSAEGCVLCSGSGIASNEGNTFSGGGITGTESISSTLYNESASCDDCVQTHTVICFDDSTQSETQTISFDWTGSGTLSDEVDYDAVHDSVYNAAMNMIASNTWQGVNSTANCWGFKDYPVDGGNMSLDPTPYDGSIIEYVNADGSTNDVAPCYQCEAWNNPDNFIGQIPPELTTVASAVTWFQIGTVDSPGVDPFDTYIYVAPMQFVASTPYIIVTYILMNDFSLVLDTYGAGSPCVDGSASGLQWVPQPNAKNLPAALFTSSGGTLSGPIGRVNVIITGTTCATWSGVTPT